MSIQKLPKIFNIYFFIAILFISFNYYVFVFQYVIINKPSMMPLILASFHIIFILLIWSMLKSIFSDPGKVPIYWGFMSQQNDNRRRRYCLLCHTFKPERCHHCSTCKRCILNMDHHCPWISNCVGFSNRKFFMLFLFYIILTIVFSVCSQTFFLTQQMIKIAEGDQKFSIHTALRILGLMAQTGFFFPISIFFKFHVDLMLQNNSTLDNLEKQRNPNAISNVYNVGAYENFIQVFGPSKHLWLLPVADLEQKFNGIIWPKNQ